MTSHDDEQDARFGNRPGVAGNAHLAGLLGWLGMAAAILERGHGVGGLAANAGGRGKTGQYPKEKGPDPKGRPPVVGF